MSYMRGENYLWSDGSRLHIWVADGRDGWDESIWASDEEGKRREERLNAGGVSISEGVMDEFVMMRVAQMIEQNLVEEAVTRAVAHNGGNFGCEALAKNAEKLKTIIGEIKSEGAA